MQISVVGGSIGGLTAALVLRNLGHDVNVYERSPHELMQRGAGIGLLPETSRYLTDVAGMEIDDISISTSTITYLARDNSTLHETNHEYRFSSWNTVYRKLLSCLNRDNYHLDHEMTRWSDINVSPVAISFANGNTVESDLVVFADGVNSIARATLIPGSKPRYSGYVAWRGMVPENEISSEALEILGDSLTYHVYANSHILVYPIPGLDGEVELGKRLINFVWYRNYTSGGDMEDLLTDVNGEQRDVSIPPGAVAAHHVAEMKAHAMARLPQAIAEIVLKTKDPFLQVVFDLAIPSMNFGHACLLGDSANLARPHAAAGTAKAADDAWALGDALASTSSVPEALEKYNQRQSAVGHQLIQRTEDIGRRSQFDGTWVPGDRDLIFGLKAPGA